MNLTYHQFRAVRHMVRYASPVIHMTKYYRQQQLANLNNVIVIFFSYGTITLLPSLTHWDRKMAATLQTFLNQISCLKVVIFKYHWNVFPMVQKTTTKKRSAVGWQHYLRQLWSSLLKYICVNRPRWVNHSRLFLNDSLLCWDPMSPYKFQRVITS